MLIVRLLSFDLRCISEIVSAQKRKWTRIKNVRSQFSLRASDAGTTYLPTAKWLLINLICSLLWQVAVVLCCLCSPSTTHTHTHTYWHTACELLRMASWTFLMMHKAIHYIPHIYLFHCFAEWVFLHHCICTRDALFAHLLILINIWCYYCWMHFILYEFNFLSYRNTNIH